MKDEVLALLKAEPQTHSVYFEIVSGVEGNCLVLSGELDEGGRRVSGPKPWGGGHVIERFPINVEEVLKKLLELK